MYQTITAKMFRDDDQRNWNGPTGSKIFITKSINLAASESPFSAKVTQDIELIRPEVFRSVFAAKTDLIHLI